MALERDEQIDALKGVLIFLVVFGHLVEPFIHELTAARVAWGSTYLFHMPLFVMVAGIFSKPTLERSDVNSLLERTLLPLIVFQLLYMAPTYLRTGFSPSLLFRPYWILWFLLSLAIWRVTLPIVKRLKAPLLLLAATAVLAGYVEAIGYSFGISRTIYFAPFFVFGHLYGRKAILLATCHRAAAAMIFAGAMIVTAFGTNAGLANSLLLGSMSYGLTLPHLMEPGIERALVMTLSLVAAVSFAGLVLVPCKAAAFLGRSSLTVFVLHGFCVLLILKIGKLFGVPPVLMVASSAPMALVVVFVLAPLDRWLTAFFAWLGRWMRIHSTRPT